MKQKTYLDQLMEDSKEFAELLEKEYRKVKIEEFKKMLKDVRSFYRNDPEGLKLFFRELETYYEKK